MLHIILYVYARALDLMWVIPMYLQTRVPGCQFIRVIPDFVGSQRFRVVGTHYPIFSGTQWFLIYVNGLAKS
jgi:hypothetical protein